MAICIYCKNEITPTNKSVEHTFPKSFGCPDDWVLDCVCVDCNNKFGVTIDNWLANDSLETVRRLQIFGSRSGERVRPKRLEIRLPKEKQLDMFQGAIMWLDFSRKNNIVMPPQVGLLNDKKEWEFFTKEDLGDSKKVEQAKNYHKNEKQIFILAPSAEAHDQMIKFLRDKDIIKTYNEKTRMGLPEKALTAENKIVIHAIGMIDSEIQRAIAKIAFNYLAKIKGEEFVLKSCFDTIREFINGNLKGKFVIPQEQPILYNDTKQFRTFDGHIFIVEREGVALVSRVTLFNGLIHKILLAANLGPILYPISSGHAFDVHTAKFIPMVGVSKNLLPKRPNY